MDPGPLHGPLFVCFSRKLLIRCYFCLRWAPLHLTFAQLPHTILSPWWREQAACFNSPLGQPPASLSTGTHSWGKAPLTAVFAKSHSKVFVLQKKTMPNLLSSALQQSPQSRDATTHLRAGFHWWFTRRGQTDRKEWNQIWPVWTTNHFPFPLHSQNHITVFGHEAAEKQHLDLGLDLRAAVIKRWKAVIFLSSSLFLLYTHHVQPVDSRQQLRPTL